MVITSLGRVSVAVGAAPAEKTEITIYGGESFPEWAAAITKLSPEFRARFTSEKSDIDPWAQFMLPATRSDVVKQTANILGFTSDKAIAVIARHYDEIVNDPKRIVENRSSAMRRIYLVDLKTAKERLKAGETIAYLRYDSNSDKIINDWSLNKAISRNDSLDMPIVISVSQEHGAIEDQLKPQLKQSADAHNRKKTTPPSVPPTTTPDLPLRPRPSLAPAAPKTTKAANQKKDKRSN